MRKPELKQFDGKLLDSLLSDESKLFIGVSYQNITMINNDNVQIITTVDGESKDFHVKDLADTLHGRVKEVKKASNAGATFKVNNLDKVDSTIHSYMVGTGATDVCAFISKKDGPSFPMHCDDVDVHLYLLKGKKTFFFENHSPITLTGTSCLIIPAGCRHRAESNEDSVMLSYGVKPSD